MLQFTARNIHLDNKKPGALSWKICCSVWYWLVCNKTLAWYILLVLQPFIVLFSEIQYVSKTNKIVYYMVIAQEEKGLSEEASRGLLEVLGGSCVSGDKMEGDGWTPSRVLCCLSWGWTESFHKVLDNFPCALSVGAQMSQECKAAAQYLLLAVHQAFIKRAQLCGEGAGRIRGHFWDQAQGKQQSVKLGLCSGGQLWPSYPLQIFLSEFSVCLLEFKARLCKALPTFSPLFAWVGMLPR